MRKATSRDVAERAGVSRSAVSMVLNGRGAGNIAPDKQAAIRAAAVALDYTPNAVALSLRNRRTATLGLVTDGIASTAFGGRIVEGAAAVAEEAGFVLVVMDTHRDAEREDQAYRTLLDRRVDALAYAAMTFREYEAPAVLLSVPSVLADCVDPTGRVPAFVPDEVGGGYRAARALLDAGHRDIVLVSGTADVPGQEHKLAVGQRDAGFRKAVAEVGGVASDPVEAGWDISDGYRAATVVLSGSSRPTGILCANDRVAVGVVLAAGALGLSVPGDLSVVGYDDDENLAPFMVPALTTVALPFRAMGEQAARRLLDALAGTAEPAPSTVLMDCPLIERSSVAPPATS